MKIQQNCFAMRGAEPCYLTQHSGDPVGMLHSAEKRHDELYGRISPIVFFNISLKEMFAAEALKKASTQRNNV